MLSPKLDALSLRLLETADAAELYAVVAANRDHLARWMAAIAPEGKGMMTTVVHALVETPPDV